MSKMDDKKQIDIKDNATLEETFSEIEEILKNLESPDINLEDSFTLYETGMKKLKYCNQQIDKVEKKMLVMNEQGELEEF